MTRKTADSINLEAEIDNITDGKISDNDYGECGVNSAEDVLQNSATDNKKIFDTFPKLIASKLNGVISWIEKNLALKTEVLTKTSQLTNDSDYTTKAYVDKAVPTKTSQLTNDSGFAYQDNIPKKVSDLENDLKFVCEGDLYSETAKFVERGGNITELENNAGYAVWGDVMAVLADSLPKNTSQLTNDSGFTTWDAVMGFIHSSDFAYKSDIPSKASELENDCGYMIPLEGLEGFLYALKAVCNNSPAEIATKSYIDTQLGVIENGSY